MERTTARPTHQGVPTYFGALCWTASNGGAHSYKHVGYSFGMATEGEMPFDADWDQWSKMLREVQQYIQKRDRENIWQWYQGVYARAMKLVPSRRREAFVDGIIGAYEDGNLWFL